METATLLNNMAEAPSYWQSVRGPEDPLLAKGLFPGRAP